MSEIVLNKENFEQEVLKSPVPVLVDFWAVWCGPCKAIAPVLDELAKEYEGKIRLGKVNVDENNEIASQFGIMSIPTIKMFKGGKIVAEMIGAAPKNQFEEMIEKSL